MMKLLSSMTIIALLYQTTESKPRKLLADDELKMGTQSDDTRCDMCEVRTMIKKDIPHMQCKKFDFDVCKGCHENHPKLKPTSKQMTQMRNLNREFDDLLLVEMRDPWRDPEVQKVKRKKSELQLEIISDGKEIKGQREEHDGEGAKSGVEKGGKSEVEKEGKPDAKSAAKSVNVSMIAAFVVIGFLMN